MPGTDVGAGLQISLSAGGRRHDLVVPVGAQVTEVLSVLGIASRANPHAVATPSGRVLGPLDTFDESVPTGSILTVVPVTTHAVTRDILNLDRGRGAGGGRSRAPAGSGGRHREPAEPVAPRAVVDESTRRRGEEPPSEVPEATTPRSGLVPSPRSRRPSSTTPRAALPSATTQLLWLAASFGAIVSLVAAWSLARSPSSRAWTTSEQVAWMPTAAAALLAAGAVGLATLGTSRSHRFAAAAIAPSLGLAAGLTLPWPASPGRESVAVVAGCAVGVLALASARTRASADSPGDRTVLATLVGLGLLVGVGTVLDWPGHSIAAVATGLGPLLMRLLPTTSLVVDSNQLVDTDRLSTTVWSVRERSAGRRRRITRDDMRARFDAAREIVAIGTAYLSVTTAVSGWLTVTTPAPDTTSRWGTLAVVVAAALACGYQSRTVRDRLPRYSMLGACGALLLAGAYSLLTSGWGGATVLAFLVATAIGWVSVVSAAALRRGYRSTRMSRFADSLEGLTVALSVPLGIVAAGGVEALRRVTSG